MDEDGDGPTDGGRAGGVHLGGGRETACLPSTTQVYAARLRELQHASRSSAAEDERVGGSDRPIPHGNATCI